MPLLVRFGKPEAGSFRAHAPVRNERRPFQADWLMCDPAYGDYFLSLI
jgi:hypothetical protein